MQVKVLIWLIKLKKLEKYFYVYVVEIKIF